MVGSMQGSTGAVPRRLRRRFFDNPLARWLVPLWRCMAFPLAVRRNRFFVPLWVLIFVLFAMVAGPQLGSAF
jgi:hypothetical protein